MNQQQRRRHVVAVVPSEQASEGAGVLLRRAVGTPALPDVGPFLLLDEMHSSDPDTYIAGFPPHPHRGFETVTYMLAGQMHHRDSTGGEGMVTCGDVQWMTAGSGVIHSEMPAQRSGLIWGFQLWLNLPSSQKMRPPEYIELKAGSIPHVDLPGVSIRVIAGTIAGATGPAPKRATELLYLNVRMTPGSKNEFAVPNGHDCFVYVYDGALIVEAGHVVDAQTPVFTKAVAQLSRHGSVVIQSPTGASFLLLAGMPLCEPIARAGPFVMNTPQELEEAVADYRQGRLVRTEVRR